MKDNKPARRQFIKATSIGLSNFVLYPALPAEKLSKLNNKEIPFPRQLNILCVGAHPGDPEFGCGGTMAKYSDAGNSVTFLYLTRGEAYNPGQSFARSAEMRTKEAEASSKILNAKAMF